MPGGRPPKYKSREERNQVRRLQNRLHVQAHRQRKKEAELLEVTRQSDNGDCDSSSEQAFPSQYDTPQTPPENEAIAAPASNIQDPRTLIADIDDASIAAPIDLCFETIQSVVSDFQKFTDHFPWLLAREQLHTDDRLVEIAVFATGARFVGRLYGDDRMIHLSRLSYHRSMQLLQKHLRRTPSMTHSLLPCFVNNAFLIFELLEDEYGVPEFQLPWKSHFWGGLALLKATGPEAFGTNLGRAVFKAFRFRMMYTSIVNRQINIFDTDGWRTMPYSHEPATQEEKLWQLIEQIPRLLSLQDKLEARGLDDDQERHQAAGDMQEKLNVLKNKLQNWQNEFVVQGPLMWVRPSVNIPYTDSKVFQWCFHFDSLYTAGCMVYYWLALLLLGDIKLSFCNSEGTLHGNVQPNELQTVLEDIDLNARNICKSLEYAFGRNQRDMRGVILCCGLPLWAATQYFHTNQTEYPNEHKWCTDVRYAASRRGFRSSWTKLVTTKHARPSNVALQRYLTTRHEQ